MPPRTIDNLGVDVSTRYAEDQRLLDEKFISESRVIPSQTQIDVSLPSFPSEIEALVHSQVTHLAWALFAMPDRYLEQKRRLFTFQLIPSLGSEEKKEALAQKMVAKLKSLAEKRKASPKKEEWRERRQVEEEEKEKKILTTLLEIITQLDKFLVDINSRRGQYQKG